MKKVLIIAEAGVNHNGDVRLAKEMVACAAYCGADIIKFQTFIPENMVTKSAQKADYQKQTTLSAESQFDMLKSLKVPICAYTGLQQECIEKGIVFLSTPFDLESIDFLNTFDMPFWKIPSGEITNLPYLIKIAKTAKDIVMSTGMANLKEIRQAVGLLRENGAGKISLLHCNTEYPTPMRDVNLNVMHTLKKEFGLDVGYSDHTEGIEVPVAAVAMGAAIIEKHFTLDKKMPGPDHKASLEPHELKAMVNAIRNIEIAKGGFDKVPTESEKKNINIARKSIVAKIDIRKGELLSEENLSVKRPGSGISPMRWFEIVGRPAPRDFKGDELIEL